MAKAALLIGCTSFDDTGIPALQAPEKDVRSLEAVLKRPDLGGFDDVQVVCNETCGNIMRKIGRFYSNRFRDDLLLLYYSGHGFNHNDRLFLACRDTDANQLDGTAVAASFVKETMKGSDSQRQIVILDCCHSGLFDPGAKSAAALPLNQSTFASEGYGCEIVASSSRTERSYDGRGIASSNSVFTHFLVEGLESGQAAQGHETTVIDLFNYVRERVTKADGRMSPRYWSSGLEKSLAIARDTTPAERRLPAELLEGLTSGPPFAREGAVNELGRLVVHQDRAVAFAAVKVLRERLVQERDYQVRAAIEAALSRGSNIAEIAQPAAPQSRDGGMTYLKASIITLIGLVFLGPFGLPIGGYFLWKAWKNQQATAVMG